MANQYTRNPHIDHFIDNGISIAQSAIKEKAKKILPHPPDAGEFSSFVRRGNLPKDGVPTSRAYSEAKVIDKQGDNDWRVSISIPPVIRELNSSLLNPLVDSGERMIFPFTPSVIFSHSASYSSMQPVHTNYPFYNYQNSAVDAITVSGDFFIETNEDAEYWVAAVTFLRTLTKMFYVVDGDAIIEEDFKFDYAVPEKDMNAVHVWRSKNPVNNLVYGYGGVKLLPRDLTLNMSIGTTDMTTSISDRFRPMEQISNVSAFNTSPFNTWKSAFRECVKLSSKVIDRQEDAETEARLDAWCKSDDLVAVDGAVAGRKYGTENKNNKEAISKINDFAWIEQIYKNGK